MINKKLLKNRNFRRTAILILFLFYVTIHLLTLCKLPSIWRDDAWMSDPSWNFLKNGNFGSSLFEGFYGLEKSNTYHGRIHLISLALVFKLFGYGPYQARIVSFLSGLLATFFIYLIGKKLFDIKVGATAAVLFLFFRTFMYYSHWARQEMMLTLFILAAIYLYLLAKNKKFLFFLCGLIASLSMDVHLNGIMLPIVIGVLFLFEYRMKFFKQIGFWFYFSGVILGIIYWIALHILPDPSLFWHQWNDYLKGIFNPPIFSGKNLFEILICETERYGYIFRYTKAGEKYLDFFEMTVTIIAMTFGIRRNPEKKILLIIVLTFISLFPLLVAQKSVFYIIYLYPFFILSIAAFSYNSKNQFRIIFGKIAVLIIILSNIFYCSFRLIESRENNFYKYLETLKSFIVPGCAIAGQPTWWYGFYNSTSKYYALAVFDGGQNLSAFIKEKNIRYILFDEYWKKNSSEETKEFLRNRCVLIATLKDKFYGAEAFLPHPTSFYTLEIYKVKDDVL